MRNVVLLLLLGLICSSAGATPAASPTTAPLDRLRQAYESHLSLTDPHGFPMKVRALASSRGNFWRGGKDLFFAWCREHCQDYVQDRESYVTQQGDQHFGNIGTYLSADGNFGRLSFGMVDFDDSHRGPFQLELLQGLVTLRLAASEAGMTLSDEQVGRLVDTVVETYASAAASRQTATTLLAADPTVAKLLSPRRTPDYANELGRYTRDGRFVPAVVTRKGDVKDILRPARDRADEFADALARAAARSPHLRSRLRHHDAAALRGAIRDVALRTRPASSGSQGLEKYFVLMDRPLKDVEHDAIFYFKQQVPTAPERAGLIPPDPRDPGRRCAEDIELVSRPDHYLSDYVELGGKSYWVTVREPWTDELDPEDIKDYDGLLAYARIWGAAAGSCHWLPDQRRVIAERTTPDLKVNLRRLSAAYVAELDRQYQAFVADPRVPALVRPAEAVLLEAARR